MQTQQIREELYDQLRPLGQKYVNMFLGEQLDREKEIDRIYDIYLSKNGTMLGDKQFNLDTSDL